MKCYVHAREGSSVDAVAACATCGMGICMEHAYEQRFPLHGPGRVTASQGALRILCPEDAKAVEEELG